MRGLDVEEALLDLAQVHVLMASGRAIFDVLILSRVVMSMRIIPTSYELALRHSKILLLKCTRIPFSTLCLCMLPRRRLYNRASVPIGHDRVLEQIYRFVS